jgi:methylmalonyl-CoA mutase cobalamin-binding subunit
MDAPFKMNKPLLLSIAAVERDTGLSKDTLRVWEKRYGFPCPERDRQGERSYPIDQVERLRLIKRLLDVGHRPGRVVSLPLSDLQMLAGRSADAQGLRPDQVRRRATMPLRQPLASGDIGAGDASDAPPSTQGPLTTDWLTSALSAVDAHAPQQLRQVLRQALVQEGLPRFLSHVASPLMYAMGDGWLRGRFGVPQEHWVSQAVQQSLHAALAQLPLPNEHDHPRILLSTFPGEAHGLGLLVAECWLHLLGAHPINLGPQTPLWDLVEAAGRYHLDVVAIGFTAAAPAPLVTDMLSELRAKLPPHVALWAGGQHPLLQRRAPDQIRVIGSPEQLAHEVAAWRLQHPGLRVN